MQRCNHRWEATEAEPESHGRFHEHICARPIGHADPFHRCVICKQAQHKCNQPHTLRQGTVRVWPNGTVQVRPVSTAR